MLTGTNTVRTYFEKLGFEKEIADIYLSLYANGPQTISELSRSSKVERTRIYRLIDSLLASNLIEVESGSKRGIIKAAPIANLNILISKKEQELKSLQDELGLIEQLLARNSLSNPAMRVQFYNGPEGMKQMSWNELSSKTRVLRITYDVAQSKTNVKLRDQWLQSANDNQIHFVEIHGDNFRKSKTARVANSLNRQLKNFEGRYISSKIYPITHNMAVFDNVVSFVIWKNGEIFGTEIYSQEIADSQRVIFETLWQQAVPETDFKDKQQ